MHKRCLCFTGGPSRNEQGVHLNPESLCHVPQRHDCCVALTKLETTNVSTINAKPLCESSLRKTGSNSKSFYVLAHHESHIFRHRQNSAGRAINCDAL